ncbi:MAG: heme ABC exporter ATP-binding protein CcmA [Alphaproteobacteria bacterium]
MTARLVVEGLGCVRGDRPVFRDIGFSLDAGGALVLTGPNGAGKSSLLRTLAGLLAPSAGRILWDGAEVAEDPEAFRRSLHFVGHADAVKPVFTVAENLSFWARLRGADAIRPALGHFGLDRLADLPAGLLSAGQRRRLTLARLLAAPAALWLLDEPAVTLDREAVAALDEAMSSHRATGGLVVVATHGDVAIPDATSLALGARAS